MLPMGAGQPFGLLAVAPLDRLDQSFVLTKSNGTAIVEVKGRLLVLPDLVLQRGALPLDARAHVREKAPERADVGEVRDAAEHRGARGEQRGGDLRERGVLRARDGHLALQAPAAGDLDRVHSSPPLAWVGGGGEPAHHLPVQAGA